MAIPSITQTIRDPGLGVTPDAITAFLYLGTSSAGTVNTVYAFGNPSDVIDTLGQGPLSEDLCYHLAIAGGPVYAVRLTGSVAGAAGEADRVDRTACNREVVAEVFGKRTLPQRVDHIGGVAERVHGADRAG